MARTVLDFTYSQRVDRPAGYDTPDVFHFYTEKKLSGVNIKVLPYGGGSLVPVRGYLLTHADQGNPSSVSQVLLNLSRLSEQAGALAIDTNFSYSSNVGVWPCSHAYLTQVQNPFGGVVEFSAAQRAHPNSLGDCASGEPVYWLPHAITSRTERDVATAQSSTWTYGGSGWNDDAYGFAKTWFSRPDGSGEVHKFEQLRQVAG